MRRSILMFSMMRKLLHDTVEHLFTQPTVVSQCPLCANPIWARCRWECTVAQCDKRTNVFFNGTTELLCPIIFLSDFTELKTGL